MCYCNYQEVLHSAYPCDASIRVVLVAHRPFAAGVDDPGDTVLIVVGEVQQRPEGAHRLLAVEVVVAVELAAARVGLALELVGEVVVIVVELRRRAAGVDHYLA